MSAVVIGGGMVGAACADALARRGHRVTLVERACVGGGATAAGMGHLVVMDDSPAQLALTSRSLELWEALAPALPAQAEYRPCGTVWVASDGEEHRGVLPKQALYQAAGREAVMLDAAELSRLEPGLRSGLSGGLRVPGDGVVDRGQQVRLADTEAAVEVHPDTGQHLTLAEQLLLARPARHRLLAERAARLHRCRLRRLRGVRPIRIEADVGKRRRWDQLCDESFRCDAGMSIDQMIDIAGPVHAGTIAACCDLTYVRRR